MPILEKFRQYHYDATVRVSENTRTLALAAIGIVWLFKKQINGAYEVPEKLLVPLLLVVLAMSLDFFQYIYRSVVWHVIFRQQEGRLKKGEITEKTELYVSSWINFAAYLFFYAKTVCLGLAYWKLLMYFIGVVRWI